MNQRELAAIHEAGHAVVAYLCGSEPSRVYINKDNSGRCETVPPVGGLSIDARLLGIVAGHVAEQVHRQKPFLTYWRGRIRVNITFCHDLEEIQQLLGLDDVWTVTAMRKIAQSERKAAQLLRKHWPAVLTLADLLVHNGHPRKAAILEILQRYRLR